MRQFSCCFLLLCGLVRKEGMRLNSIDSDITLYDVTRDYATVDINTSYLIQYTDENDPIYFRNTFLNILSSIPFLGGIINSAFDVDSDLRSTIITTEGMQLTSNRDSGLGTSLVGDVYYTAKGIFVVIFFYILGYVLSYSFYEFEVRKKFNIWLLVIYVFSVANSIYCIRAEWNMPFRYLGFSFVLIILFYFLFPVQSVKQ